MTTDAWLPPKSVLVHIGPHKTGTTALQGAFKLASDRLQAEGIHYAGRDRPRMRVAIAALTSPTPRVAAVWDELIDDLAQAADKRVVISNEFLCEAGDIASRRIVSDLGGERVHIVVTLRPWAELLASQWQQFVRNGLLTPYEEWLDVMLNKSRPSTTAQTFRLRHDHGALTDRWAGVVGPERVAVLVAGQGDRTTVLRGFESMLGLDEGFLVPEPSDSNRSLTMGEVELLRLLNVEFYERGWTRAHHNSLLRHGVVQAVRARQHPGRDEPRITTPAWALDRASEAGAAAAARIAESGVRVIGDLSSLSARPAEVSAAGNAAPAVAPFLPPEAAVQAVIGAILASRVTDPIVPPPPVGNAREVRMLTSRELVGVLAKRVRRRLGRSGSGSA
jgi:hypothetical protein